jgi:Phosphotransferase enzyme family
MRDAAVAAALEAGLSVEDAEVVNVGTHVLVRMGDVAARVTGDGAMAQFAGSLEAEVRVAGALHAAGAPVIPPLSPRVHDHDGRKVTLWRWWDMRREDEPDGIGRALSDCHRTLETVEVPLEAWAKLTEARARLPEVEHRDLLAPWLAPPDVPLRAIHGDAHAGNVLPGPVWHDWEDAQLGCVEWDLACLVAPGRVLGTDFGWGEAILAGYDLPYDAELLDHCVAARTAQQCVYGLVLGDTIPGLPERIAPRLEWLRSRP